MQKRMLAALTATLVLTVSLPAYAGGHTLAGDWVPDHNLFEHPGHDKPDYDKPDYDKPDHDKPDYDKPDYDKPDYDKPDRPDHHDKPKDGHDKPDDKPHNPDNPGPNPDPVTPAALDSEVCDDDQDITITRVYTPEDVASVNDEVIIQLINSCGFDFDGNIGGLRLAIAANAAITGELASGGYGIDDVVAIIITNDGDAIIYVRDRFLEDNAGKSLV